jgi:4-carboxymuconolactone decarboxylase
MARVRYLDQDDLELVDRDLLTWPANSNRAMANRPDGLRAVLGFARWVQGNSVPAMLRELAILAVAAATNSESVWTQHVRLGRSAGLPETTIASVREAVARRDRGDLGDAEGTAVVAATALTLDRDLSDELFDQLREYLSETQVIDLVLTIGFYNQAVRTISALRVDLEPSSADVLHTLPLATP